METIQIPTPRQIEQARERLGNRVRRTPVWQWKGDVKERFLGKGTQAYLKLELFQYAGSFKPRGALMNMLDLSDEQLEKGVTAVSAGNHAIAVAYAAQSVGTTAKVVMPQTANQFRIDRCKSHGAVVELVDDVHIAFKRVKEIEEEEQRTFIHPFEGEKTALGTATVGLELQQECPNLDAVIVPIGGGGLCAGIATAIKQTIEDCAVYGVEPVGADSMSKSLEAGQPVEIEKVDTIAASLGAPHAAPYSFGLCKRFVDEVVTITDLKMAQMMRTMFEELKLAVEPAGASALAAAAGPLADKIEGKKVGIIVCGTNIDTQSFQTILDNTK
ncbi:threonine ammonia-lyase [Fodinibius halophilus]|uniref:Threonine/serine dehydratase n=1 Tax=Fodinibius halophilus TaxID=1736908 RepID=A0A6M1T0K3_9BACT|nr:threonine/serine dehydratase [Fodinibius halophilus]NGP86735.1 threonine/serine dehydratase [Fodinibius halophilus]